MRDLLLRPRALALWAPLSALLLALACAHEEPVPTRTGAKSAAPGACLEAPSGWPKPSAQAERDFARAKVAFQQGLRAEAEGRDPTPAFAKAVSEDPTFGLAHLELAESLLTAVSLDPERVGEHAAIAVRLLPRNPRAQAMFGRYAEIIGDAELAARHYGCALERRADLDDVRYRRSVQLFDLGRLGEAGAELRALLERDRSAVSARVLFARVLEAEGRLELAAQQLEAAARHAGSSPVLLRRAAALYERAGVIDASERLSAEADARAPPREARDLRPLRPSRR